MQWTLEAYLINNKDAIILCECVWIFMEHVSCFISSQVHNAPKMGIWIGHLHKLEFYVILDAGYRIGFKAGWTNYLNKLFFNFWEDCAKLETGGGGKWHSSKQWTRRKKAQDWPKTETSHCSHGCVARKSYFQQLILV